MFLIDTQVNDTGPLFTCW